MAKEEWIKKILASDMVDRFNNKVQVKYLYDKKKLLDLGENFYGATKRVSELHNRIMSKTEVASGMDQYINEQVENKKYLEIKHAAPTINYILWVTIL